MDNIFTVLDSKRECLGYYYNGDIKESKTSKQVVTWDYKGTSHDEMIEYTKLYANGKSLTEVCPDHLKDEWERLQEKRLAFQSAVLVSKMEASTACAYDIIPQWFLKEYSQVKCEIIEWAFSNLDRPHNYSKMSGLERLFYDIKKNNLKIDLTAMKNDASSLAVRRQLKRLSGVNNTISYNQFGSVTGRLTVEKNSFPILNLPKNFRKVVKPNNDLFVEFDYNAAELRTLLALMEMPQPNGDIHEWNVKNIFNDSVTREEAKKRVFAWLYNPESKDEILNKTYDRQLVLSKYWDGTTVKTPFGREIEASRHYALNYIIQSTTSDLVLEKVLGIQKFLESSSSKIVFLIHDSFVLDIPAEERYNMAGIRNMFASTRFGKFGVGVSAGKDFGNMKEIEL